MKHGKASTGRPCHINGSCRQRPAGKCDRLATHVTVQQPAEVTAESSLSQRGCHGGAGVPWLARWCKARDVGIVLPNLVVLLAFPLFPPQKLPCGIGQHQRADALQCMNRQAGHARIVCMAAQPVAGSLLALPVACPAVAEAGTSRVRLDPVLLCASYAAADPTGNTSRSYPPPTSHGLHQIVPVVNCGCGSCKLLQQLRWQRRQRQRRRAAR